MTLPLDPETLRAAYDFLNTTPPFNRWNLPDGEDVVFKVVRDPRRFGWHTVRGGKHAICISEANIAHTTTLLAVMAHEMVHVHEQHARVCRMGVHSAAFRKFAEQVSRVHGFDAKAF